MAIKHAYTSAKDDPVDSSLIGKSKWNADHTIEAGTITNSHVNSAAAVAVTKLAYGSKYQTLRTNAAGNAVEWGVAIHIGATAPSSPATNTIWFDTSA